MDFSSVCRTCLSGEALNPIFLNPDEHKRYSVAVYIVAGVKVEYNDNLPQKMCTPCINFLNNSLKYRKKCKDVETYLLKIKEDLEKDCIEKIEYCPKKDDEIEVKIEYSNCGNVKKPEEQVDLQKHELNTEAVPTDPDERKGSDVDVSETESDPQVEFVEEGKRQEVARDGELHYSLTDKDNRISCKLCQKELSIRSLDRHLERYHPGADGKAQCELCDKYVGRRQMARHVKLMHGGGKALRCGYCKSEFDTKDILINHVSTCTAKKKKRKIYEAGRKLIECDVCKKKMQKASLRMHKAIKHAGLGPVCEHCGRTFANKYRLTEHLRARHGYEKFKCSYCDFQSSGAMSMRNHERRHRGEKPFQCETCGAKFHAAYLLAQHKQSHRTEKLIKCDRCPASFKANNSLHMHKTTCHSDCLFQCPLCPRAYSSRHYAARHLRNVHSYKGPIAPLQRIQPRPPSRRV